MTGHATSNLRGYSQTKLYDHLKSVIEDAFRRHREENEARCAQVGWSMDDYRFDGSDGKVNLLGARGFSKDAMAPCVSTNMAWDDTCFVIYKLNGEKHVDSYYLNTEQNMVDKDKDPDGGKSFLVTGTHRYRLGYHRGRRALEPAPLVQTIYDKNQNYIDDEQKGPQWIDSINIHDGGNESSPAKSSLGCQTISKHAGYDAFLARIESDTSIIGSIDNESVPKPARDGTRVLIYTLVEGSQLVGADAPASDRGTKHPKGDYIPKPSKSPKPRTGPERMPAKDRPVVKVGSTGRAVEVLKKRLTRHGHDPGPVDGNFEARTDAAVRSFQKANSLAADGIVGPNTWAALMARAKSRQ